MRYSPDAEPLRPDQIEERAHDPRAFVPPRRTELNPDDAYSPQFVPGLNNAPPTIFYKRHELITTLEYADVVGRVLAEMGLLADPDDQLPAPRYEKRLPDPRQEASDREEEDAGMGIRTFIVNQDSLSVARMVKTLGSDPSSPVPAAVRVGPHHVLNLAPQPSIGPGGDPRPHSEAPADGAKTDREPPPIVVVDTGVWRMPQPPPAEVEATLSSDRDVEIVDSEPDGFVDERGSAHGGFIAGVILSRLPNAPVKSFNAFEADGLTELSVIRQVERALQHDKIVILNLSLGSYEDRECGGTEVVALREAMARWAETDGLIVAAAGNDSLASPWYPAGFAAPNEYPDSVVSVGALESACDGPGVHSKVAAFSNYGPWVTAWAPGVDVASYYPNDMKYMYYEADGVTEAGSGVFNDGLALWDGTSFAAPFVAAEIARYAADNKLNPKAAWKALRDGRPFVVFWPMV
ncbi:MAG: S8 family serine peptidase [Polyangiales bacterium]